MSQYKNQLDKDGFTIIENVFTDGEINNIISTINSADQGNSSFRKTDDLFAIRTFLKTIPETNQIIWNKNILKIIHQLFGEGYFVVKSIYFDKPPQSNWFVAWHQDLTISVDKKIDASGFGLWTVKQGQIAVQPPTSILENIYTIRIHLDDCDETNGALKVIRGSHNNGIVRTESVTNVSNEALCNVKKGGIMIMRPLLLHSSSRSISDKQRRVIHIEFANMELPYGLIWRERSNLN